MSSGKKSPSKKHAKKNKLSNKRSFNKGIYGRTKGALKHYPFEEVKLVYFSFFAKERDAIAFFQYKLLLNPEIIQVHLDFDSNEGIVASLPLVDLSKELLALGLKHKFLRVEWLPYKDFVMKNTVCSA